MKTKFKSQRKGAVLATVTVVSVMMVVIIIAATQLVAHTTARTNKEYRKKQAYYVASSCLKAFVAETTGSRQTNATYTQAEIMEKINQMKRIAKAGETEVKIESLVHGKERVGKSQPRWNNAKCTLKVEPVIDGNYNYLKAIATGSYLGQEKQVVAYLACEPLREHTYTPKALEIIGTTGGISDRFNNIQVYGSAGATDKDSDKYNTPYKFNTNQNKIYGDTDINGSLSIQNQNYFKSNPYYYPGVDDSKGCVLNVSRSLMVQANQPHFEPSHSKAIYDDSLNPQLPAWNFNYVNVAEALVVGGNNVDFGVKTDYAVDVYTSYLYIGGESKFDSNMIDAMAETNPDKNEYWKAMTKDSNGNTVWGQGQDNNFRGNIYVYNSSPAFNGDMVVTGINNKFYGDIYLEGDLYIDGPTTGQFNQSGVNITIHLLPKKADGKVPHIYSGSRSFNGVSVDDPAGKNTIIDSNYNVVVENWTGIARANRPQFPMLTETPYYYYPEHLLCLDNSNVTNISGMYKEMYEVGEDGKQNVLKSSVKNVKDPDFSNKNSDGTYKEVIGDGSDNGAIFKPDYIVNKSVCYIDYLENDKILIDVDAAKSDVIVVLKNGGHTQNNNIILVRNSSDPEKPNAHFCYFVSDSGVGTVYDQYSSSGEVSTYEHSTFVDKPNFTFRTQLVLMDLESFLHSDAFKGSETAKGNDGYLNPTGDKDLGGYQLNSNNIIMLFTEGTVIKFDECTNLVQASIYMPRAKYWSTNKGGQCKIAPDYMNNDCDALAVIGNLICNEYEVSGNCNTIVYNEVSPYSVLATVKGSGEEYAEECFVLKKYAAY